jgi:hypothetical protein
MQYLLNQFTALFEAHTYEYDPIPITDRELNRKDVNKAIVNASRYAALAWDGKATKYPKK